MMIKKLDLFEMEKPVEEIPRFDECMLINGDWINTVHQPSSFDKVLEIPDMGKNWRYFIAQDRGNSPLIYRMKVE